MKTRWMVVAAGLMLTAACLWAAGNDAATDKAVEQAVAEAMKAYKDGRSSDAVEALQRAIAAIQKSQQKGLAGALPKAPAGWTAGEVESNSISINSDSGPVTYTTLSRTYTRTADEATLQLQLTDSPQLIEAQKGVAQMFTNPQYLAMLRQDPNQKIEVIHKDGWTGWKITHKGESADAVALCTRLLLTLNASKDDMAILDQFLNATDLKTLAGAQPKAAKQP